ncbi:hypothetical protein ACN265_18685 [Micromonospora sp. WMMD730]|uniref:hypothetical protein n=1 Tax=Micromonospora sp. WMMD730 TaxID=3404128 RepID=UPI003B948EA1
MAICGAAEQGPVETRFVPTDPPAGTPRIIPLREDGGAVDHRDSAAVTTPRHRVRGTPPPHPGHGTDGSGPAVLNAYWLPSVGKV